MQVCANVCFVCIYVMYVLILFISGCVVLYVFAVTYSDLVIFYVCMYGMIRYPFLESGLKGWDDNKPAEENSKAFSWVPGIAYRPEREAQVRALLQGHPRAEQVVQAIAELHGWLSDGGG
jgi:hypothetical protein